MSTRPKLDHKDPWRYACPNCGSCTIKSLSRKYKRKRVNHDFRCPECSNKFNRPIDKKTGKPAK